MNHLDELENKSIYIIREAYFQFKRTGLLWSMGKDSTTLLWLCRKAFLGDLPFPVIHIDTGRKFREIYEFRDRLAAEWGLDLRVARNGQALADGVGPDKSKIDCCTELKTNALKQYLAANDHAALLLAIRRDEHGVRAKERVFSPRDQSFHWDYKSQPPELWDQYCFGKPAGEHVRVHPLLGWREIDVWEYVKRENIPMVSLYLAKDGRRFRSIGCECCCGSVGSTADSIDKIVAELKVSKVSERSGRAQDKESAFIMQKLRALGYM